MTPLAGALSPLGRAAGGPRLDADAAAFIAAAAISDSTQIVAVAELVGHRPARSLWAKMAALLTTLPHGEYVYDLQATIGGRIVTLAQGKLLVRSRAS